MLLFGGLFLYGTALVPMRRMLHNIVMGNRHVQGGGVLREIQASVPGSRPLDCALSSSDDTDSNAPGQMLFLGFVASLLPGWNFNPEDAAAFQAGQEMAAGEGAARGNERDHQD